MTPPALERVVKVCLAKDPDDRLQTAHDVMQERAAPNRLRRYRREEMLSSAWGSTPVSVECPRCRSASPATGSFCGALGSAADVDFVSFVLPADAKKIGFGAAYSMQGLAIELTPDERAEMLALLDVAKADLDREFAPQAYNIGINDGPAAGQTVPHLHIHLIPRYDGDRPDPRGGVRWLFPDKADYWSRR